MLLWLETDDVELLDDSSTRVKQTVISMKSIFAVTLLPTPMTAIAAPKPTSLMSAGVQVTPHRSEVSSPYSRIVSVPGQATSDALSCTV